MTRVEETKSIKVGFMQVDAATAGMCMHGAERSAPRSIWGKHH